MWLTAREMKRMTIDKERPEDELIAGTALERFRTASAALERFRTAYPSVEQWRQNLAITPARTVRTTTSSDVHRHTVYHNVSFQNLMDEVYGPRWRGWPYSITRRYAKVYNFTRGSAAYGMGAAKLRKLLANTE